MGVGVPGYNSHENGNRGLGRGDISARYAKFFRVSLEWLLSGKGDMRGRGKGSIPLLGHVGAGSSVQPITDSAWDETVDHVDLPDPASCFALQVRGDSGFPRYEDSDILICERMPISPDQMINRYCVLDLADGRRVAKRLKKYHGRYMLQSENIEVGLEDAPMIIACYRIVATIEGRS